jgi:hypothetical protein
MLTENLQQQTQTQGSTPEGSRIPPYSQVDHFDRSLDPQTPQKRSSRTEQLEISLHGSQPTLLSEIETTASEPNASKNESPRSGSIAELQQTHGSGAFERLFSSGAIETPDQLTKRVESIFEDSNGFIHEVDSIVREEQGLYEPSHARPKFGFSDGEDDQGQFAFQYEDEIPNDSAKRSAKQLPKQPAISQFTKRQPAKQSARPKEVSRLYSAPPPKQTRSRRINAGHNNDPDSSDSSSSSSSSSHRSARRSSCKKHSKRHHRKRYESSDSSDDDDIPLKYQDVRIQKLKTPEEFPSWELGMQTILLREGTSDLVNGNLEKPDKESKAYRKWKKLNRRAVIFIKVNCGLELQERLRDEKDARAIWLYIEKSYGRFTTAQGIEACVKLSRIRYDDHKTMRSYFAAAYKYMTQINRRSGERPIPKWLVCVFLVKGLPTRFDIWSSEFMRKVEHHDCYHLAFDLEELESDLTAAEAWINGGNEEANIVRAARGKSKGRGKFNKTNQSSNQWSGQNSGQNVHRGNQGSRGRGRGRGGRRPTNNTAPMLLL